MKYLLTLITGALLSLHTYAAEQFPLRDKYPDLTVIEKQALLDCKADCLVVDVRSKLEFNVIHINGAKHNDLSKKSFVNKVKKYRSQNPGKKIVFYCNGHTCSKSYKANKKATAAGISNLATFDAGVFNWAQSFPEHTTILGATPAAQNMIISKAEFEATLIDTTSLKNKMNASDTVIIDVRENKAQQNTIAGALHIPLNKLQASMMNAQHKDKHIVFVDAVGKQVKWLQYYLKKFGYSNYSFLRGGAASLNQ